MPLYEIQHIVPLTGAQQDELAQAITQIHSAKFKTPRIFVNVKFTDSQHVSTYIGGKRRQGNLILAHVRAGPSRTRNDWDTLCREIVAVWNSIAPMPKTRRAAPDLDYSLRGCVILGDIMAGYEAGFMLPAAGEDINWLQEHWQEFQAKAQGGDEDFQDLIAEVEERRLLENGSGLTSTQKLEEMLGWGDAA